MKDRIKSQNRQLATFYKRVVTAIFKSPNKAISLASIEAMNPKWVDGCFGWMQWKEAKQWFTTITHGKPGCWYTIHKQHDGMTMLELHKEINQYYNLYQYDDKD